MNTLHSEETEAWGGAGYQGADKHPDAQDGVRWNIAMRLGKRRLLGTACLVDEGRDQLERLKASSQAKVEHPFRVDQAPVRTREGALPGPTKSTAQRHMLSALSNQWMTRRTLIGVQA